MDGTLVHERENYLKEVAAHGGLRSQALLRAFAAVPRERYLPPGPWFVEAADGTCYATEGDDVAHILHAFGVAIDVSRFLINANPARIGRMLEAAGIGTGHTVLHVGAGLGYFTAVIAELVGTGGRVIAAEIDPVLADKAKGNLADYPQVEMVGDALQCQLPPLDIVFVSAGVAGLPLAWINALKPGGRMILPMTGSIDGGFLFRFEKADDPVWLTAEVRSFVRFYPCQGTRSAGEKMAMDKAIGDPRAKSVRRLRLDLHDQEAQCWLHGDGWCLTTRASPLEP